MLKLYGDKFFRHAVPPLLHEQCRFVKLVQSRDQDECLEADFGYKHRVGESYEFDTAPTVMIDGAVRTIKVRLECLARGFSLTSCESEVDGSCHS